MLDFYIANRWFLNYSDAFDYPEILTNDIKRKEIGELFGEYIKHFSVKFRDVIYAWDLFNEPEWAWAISFKTIIPENDPRAKYVKEMYSIGKEKSQGIPITIGWSRKENMLRFKDFSDILQCHCYNENFLYLLNHLRERTGEKKFFVGEVGARDLKAMEFILKEAMAGDIQILFWDSPNKYIFDHNLFKKYQQL